MSTQRYTPEFKAEAVRQLNAAIQSRRLPHASASRLTASING